MIRTVYPAATPGLGTSLDDHLGKGVDFVWLSIREFWEWDFLKLFWDSGLVFIKISDYVLLFGK